MSSKITVRLVPAFMWGAAAIAGGATGCMHATDSRPLRPSLSGTSELGYAFLVPEEMTILLLANMMPITVSVVSALLKVAVLPGRGEGAAGTLSGAELRMKSKPPKISPFICSGQGVLPNSASDGRETPLALGTGTSREGPKQIWPEH